MSNSILPDNQIRSIAVDKEGDKWFGTYNGLVKFDGINWSIYNKSNSGLPVNSVLSLAIDKEGNKWIGTYNGGLVKFDGVNWKVYNIKNSSLPDNIILSIAIDKEGNKWIGTNFHGLVKFDGENWTTYNTNNSGLPDNQIRSIAVDKEGNKWIGTYQGGLSKFDGVKWIVYNQDNSKLPDDKVLSVAIDSKGNKWIDMFNGGLAKFDRLNWTIYNMSDTEFQCNSVLSIVIDIEGNKWIGMYSGGLTKFDGKKLIKYKISNSGLPDNFVQSIAIDINGNKWIGTSFAGITELEDGGPRALDLDEIYVISGNVYFDKNRNKIKDENEKYIGGQKVILLPDSLITSTDETGKYTFTVNPGKYKIRYLSDNIWELSTDSLEYNFNVNDSDVIIKDFGVYPLSANLEAKLKVLISSSITRCGSESSYFIDYMNKGFTKGDGIIGFKKDKLLKIEYCFPVQDSIAVDSSVYFWKFKGLYPTEDRQIKLNFRIPGHEAVGDTLISIAYGKIVTKLSNKISIGYNKNSSIVRCSWDPNEKTVEPWGIGEKKLTLGSDTLRYTIHFQNTGNDTAFDIRVKDTLNNRVDLNSFRVVASSHKVRTEINKYGVVTFYFDNILLPDSGKDYSGSNGFVSYEVILKDGALPFTLKNTGYIYFDYNPAVVTNTAVSEMVSALPSTGVEKLRDLTGFQNLSGLRVFPNPNNGEFVVEINGAINEKGSIKIYDVIGNVVKELKMKN
ncbi:MAG: two-component regulator propeller domain-containing protein [Bacteroidota bacterium]|nr:two-component regulator propeller domain-containing protein [Bacteroidota bacterium]